MHVKQYVEQHLSGMSTVNIRLLQLQIQSHLQKLGLPNAGTSELIPKKKPLNFLRLHSPFCFFLMKMLKLNCYSEYLSPQYGFIIIRIFCTIFESYNPFSFRNNKKKQCKKRRKCKRFVPVA